MILNGQKVIQKKKCWRKTAGVIHCLDLRCDLYPVGYDRKIENRVVHVDRGCFEAYFIEQYCRGKQDANETA